MSVVYSDSLNNMSNNGEVGSTGNNARSDTAMFTSHDRGKSISHLKMLGNTRGVVSADTSLRLYETLITPLFDYVAPAYDCLSKKDSYTLQKVQYTHIGECVFRGEKAGRHKHEQTQGLLQGVPFPSQPFTHPSIQYH